MDRERYTASYISLNHDGLKLDNYLITFLPLASKFVLQFQ